MKVPDIYHSWRTMLGIALILLGSGNWVVGRFNTERYGQLLASERTAAPDQAYRGFDDLDSGAVAVLALLTAEQRRASYETARMDFYHATFLTGYVLVLAGLLITCFGFLGLLRSDARRATTRATPAAVTSRLPPTPDSKA